MVVCPETAKTGLINIRLACRLGKPYDFGVFRLFRKYLCPEPDPKWGSAFVDSQVEALFRSRKVSYFHHA